MASSDTRTPALLEFVGGLRDEVADERRNLVAALAQRRDAQADDVQPVEQVLAEAPVLHLLLDVGVGRGDDADVDGERGGFADRADFAVLEEAEELGLQVQAELADLVEEERAVPRGADEARMVAVGARERAPAMAEQLALEHVARHRGAVERNERFRGAVGIAVNRAGEDFLAGAAFPRDEDAGAGAPDAFGVGHQLAHGTAHHGVLRLLAVVVRRPEADPLFAFGAGALQVLNRCQQRRDGADRGLGIDVAADDEVELD